MVRKITALFIPIDAYGHFFACIGLAEPLRDRGHNVVFATPNGWKGKLEALGFGEEGYSTGGSDAIAKSSDEQSRDLCDLIKTLAPAMAKSPLHQIKEFTCPTCRIGLDMVRNSDESLRKIISKVKPDVIIVDTIYCQPSVVTSGIPWILSSSLAPLGITKENSPPAFSGYSITGDKTEWNEFEEAMVKDIGKIHETFNAWAIENGSDPIPKNFPFLINYSPYANIYMYPKELDYTEHRPNPPNWFQFDTYIRSSNASFSIPESLKDLPGRLIYFSMGSLGGCETGLMKRLVDILGKAPHRFIVSKGPNGDQYDLHENMWGANMVPQTAIIPQVDLVITHGGNNTVDEAFYYGKPCILLPIFSDQHDNAQRIYELGLGLKFKPYHVTAEELLAGIENTLANSRLISKMKTISKRMQESNSQSRAADLIESVAFQKS